MGAGTRDRSRTDDEAPGNAADVGPIADTLCSYLESTNACAETSATAAPACIGGLTGSDRCCWFCATDRGEHDSVRLSRSMPLALQASHSAPPAWMLVVVYVFSLVVLVAAAIGMTAWRARHGKLTGRSIGVGLAVVGLLMAIGLGGFIGLAASQGTTDGFPAIWLAMVLDIVAFASVVGAVIATRRHFSQ